MLEFDRDSHRYTFNGQVLPHVTQVTDALSSYAGVPADVLQRAAEIGDAVHYACELDDQGDLEDSSLPAEIQGFVIAWRRFKEESGFEATHIEHRVASLTYRYAGTLDRVGRFHRLKRVKPRERCLIDIKTTYAVLPSCGPQLAAYACAWNEGIPMNEHVTRRFIVQLKADTTYRLEEFTEVTDLSVFLSALTLLAWRQRHNLEKAA